MIFLSFLHVRGGPRMVVSTVTFHAMIFLSFLHVRGGPRVVVSTATFHAMIFLSFLHVRGGLGWWLAPLPFTL